MTNRFVDLLIPLLALAALLVVLAWFFSGTNTELTVQLAAVASVAWNLLYLALVAGIAAMAAVQFGKVAFRSRGRYHLRSLQRIFGDDLELLVPPADRAGSRRPEEASRPDDLVGQLDLPLEQLMARLASTTERALQNPESHSKFIKALGGPTAYELATANDPSKSAPRLRMLIEEQLDALQLQLRNRWRRRVRLAAAGIAGLVGLSTLFLVGADPEAKLAVLVVCGVWGGFFSWLARDLAAAVEGWRD